MDESGYITIKDFFNYVIKKGKLIQFEIKYLKKTII